MRKKKEWVKMGDYFLRSTIMGALISTTTAVFGCTLRKLMGNKFTYYTYLLLPNMLNGLFIYMEPPSRRGLVINLFANLLIEFYLNSLSRAGYLTITKSKITFMFMVGSALLFYLMRLEGEREQRTPLFWIYTPERVRRKSDEFQNVCPHEGSCQKFIAKGSAKYFGIGLAISMARLILPKIRTPLRAISSIRSKHFKMALFFSSYIGIYRAVICYLCRKKGFDSALYALPAGYLAGLSSIFSPSLGISIAALTGAFKLYSTILYEKKILPTSIPLPELLYCFCQGTLFNARFLHAEVCPSYMFNLMDTVSNGVSKVLYENMMNEIKKVT
ncbi:transmembrane protein 135-like isoform X2 [Pectinophora gossypiella]|nr:transmembrane protein 135-like isoform X2 [Pectinophora gossypiella]